MVRVKGIILKQALQAKGIRAEDAAKSLNRTRQTLTNWFGRDNLGEDIINEVREKLDIDLSNGKTVEEEKSLLDHPVVKEILSTKDRLINRLESHLQDKEEIIQLLKKGG